MNAGAPRKWEFDAHDFSDDEVRAAFCFWGFVVIRSVLDRHEVNSVRSHLDAAFASAHLKSLPTMCSSELLKQEPVWSVLFKDTVVKSLKAALGRDLCYQNDLDVQRDSFGLIRWHRHTGWHMDAGSETGNEYLTAPDYRFAKGGIFLQDFDNGWGGGIRVKPKSHRALSEAHAFKRQLFLLRRSCNRIASNLRLDVDTFAVPTRAGDFCFFDSRLLHSSAPLSRKNIRTIGCDRRDNAKRYWSEIPKEHTKYVIYWDACNVAMAENFLQNSIKRAEGEKSGMNETPSLQAVYSRILSLAYPDDFPDAFAAAASNSGVSVASLSADRAAFYKRKLETIRSC